MHNIKDLRKNLEIFKKKFKERNIEVSNVPDFTKVVIKIVMKSTDSASVPKVQAFRLICHS